MKIHQLASREFRIICGHTWWAALFAVIAASFHINAAEGPKSSSEERAFHIAFVDRDDGLRHNNVQSIFFDSDRILWVGSRSGLQQYDGARFIERFNMEVNGPVLKNDRILALASAGDRRIWIAPEEHIFHLDITTARITPLPMQYRSQATVPPPGKVTSISAIENHGITFFGTESGLYFLPQNTKVSSENNVQPVTSVAQSLGVTALTAKDNVLWIATDGEGLKALRLPNRQTLSLSVGQQLPSDLTSLLLDSHGHLWIGSRHDGVYMANIQSTEGSQVSLNIQHTLPRHEAITSLAEDGLGRVWVGTEKDGITVLDSEGTSLHHLLSTRSSLPPCITGINSFAEGPSPATMFAATSDFGIAIIRTIDQVITNPIHEASRSTGITINQVAAIAAESSGALWIGTENGHLYHLSKHQRTLSEVSYFKDRPSNRPGRLLSLAIDAENRLWIGTSRGIHAIDLRSQLPLTDSFRSEHSDTLRDGRVYTIATTHDHYVYAGTNDGLFELDSRGTELRRFTETSQEPQRISGNRIRAIYEDSDHFLWIGTNKGLDQFDRTSDSFASLRSSKEKQNTLSDNRIRAIYQSEANTLWIGTGTGLNRLNVETKSIDRFHIAGRYPVVNSIQGNAPNTLWLTTDRGLFEISPSMKQAARIPMTDWGLNISTFARGAAAGSQDGVLYFGGLEGITAVKANQPFVSSSTQRIILHDVEVFGVRFSPMNVAEVGNRLNLAPSQHSFRISFGLPSWEAPDQLNYEYRLVGHDPTWISAGPRGEANYSHIKPGNYTFTARVKDEYGNLVESTQLLTLNLPPVMWKTRWFQASIIILFLATLFAAYSIRTNWLRAHNRRLNEKNEQLSREISIRRKAESDLEKATKVAECAQADAEAADRAKSAFLANMSHEMRTPLNGVIGVADLLADEANSKESIEHIDLIRTSGKMLLGVIDDILDFSDLENRTIELKLEHCLVAEIIEEVIEAAYFENPGTTIQSAYYIDVEAPTQIYTDSTRLRQILTKLVSNAFKFTEEGYLDIRFSVVSREADTAYYKIAVRDTGIGIPEDRLDHLFRPFTQLDSSTTRRHGGTGLGLIITKRLCNLMGGDIRVQSTIGEGTTFVVELPVQKPTNSPAEPTIALPESRGSMLLIHDSFRTRCDFLSQAAKNSGFEPFGPEIFEQAKDWANDLSIFDFLIVDLDKPATSSEAILQAIGSNQGSSAIGIFEIAKHPDEKNVVAKLVHTLSKPLTQKKTNEMFNALAK